jgi:hypothetical protein
MALGVGHGEVFKCKPQLETIIPKTSLWILKGLSAGAPKAISLELRLDVTVRSQLLPTFVTNCSIWVSVSYQTLIFNCTSSPVLLSEIPWKRKPSTVSQFTALLHSNFRFKFGAINFISEAFARLGCQVMYVRSSLPISRENIPVLSLKVKQYKEHTSWNAWRWWQATNT